MQERDCPDSRGRPCDRRQFLKTLALPAATAIISGCHGGQDDEPMHEPEVSTGALIHPDALPPPLHTVREYPLPPGTAPAIVFRASFPEPM